MNVGWCVYIISNNSHVIYCGITNDILARFQEHKSGRYKNAFTSRYTWDRLVFLEWMANEGDAARRERQIKGWRREKKVRLIQALNPNWLDLSLTLDEALKLH